METVSNFFTDDMYDHYQNTALRRRRPRNGPEVVKRSRQPHKKTWYSDGYPALREADQMAREKRKPRTKSKTTSRRSRSLPHESSYYDRQRTKSIYKDTTERLRSSSVSSRSIYNGTRSRSNSVSSVRSRREIYTPSNVIYKTYTGIDTNDEIKSRVGSSYSVRSRIGSSKSNAGGIVHKRVESVKPHMRDSYVLNDIQSRSYQKMHQTYDMVGTDAKWITETMKRLKLEGGRVRNLHTHMDDVYRFLVDNSVKQFERLGKLTRKYESAAKTRYQTIDADSPRLMKAKSNRLSERGLADTMSIQNQRTQQRNGGRLKPMASRPQPKNDRVNVYMPTEENTGRTQYSNRYRSRSDNTHTRSRRLDNRRNAPPPIPILKTNRRSHPFKLKPLGHNLNKHRILDERQTGTRLAT